MECHKGFWLLLNCTWHCCDLFGKSWWYLEIYWNKALCFSHGHNETCLFSKPKLPIPHELAIISSVSFHWHLAFLSDPGPRFPALDRWTGGFFGVGSFRCGETVGESDKPWGSTRNHWGEGKHGGGRYMDVSKNRGGPPKSSILIGFFTINNPFWSTPIFENTHMGGIFLIYGWWGMNK